MNRSLIGAAAALTLLAGCSGKQGAGNSSGAAGEPQAQEPANLETDPYVEAIPVTPPSPAPLATLPATMQGRWGIGAADCDPAKADVAKGLMVIAGDRLSFYESRGTASHIVQRVGGDLSLDLAMSGEGQTWSEPTRLTLQGDGRTLIRQAKGPHDRAGVYMYLRCPA